MLVLLITIPAAALEVLDYVYSVREGGTVVFSHDKHFKALLPKDSVSGDSCTICHTTIYNTRGKRTFTMAEMYKGRSCGACHGKRAFSLSKCGAPVTRAKRLLPWKTVPDAIWLAMC